MSIAEKRLRLQPLTNRLSANPISRDDFRFGSRDLIQPAVSPAVRESSLAAGRGLDLVPSVDLRLRYGRLIGAL